MTQIASFPRSPISLPVLFPTMRYSFRPSLILSALARLLTTFAAAPAAAQSQDAAPQEIREMLERRDQEIKSILKGDTNFSAQQRDELKTLINGVIDFEAMGQIALGPFWSDLDAGQREEFVTVFRDIVRAQSLSDLEVYNSKVTYETIRVEGDSAFVETVTEYKGTSTPVIYDLARENDTWVAEDIVVDGVSTAESYARSFQTVIRKRGFDSLMTALQKKRDKVLAES